VADLEAANCFYANILALQQITRPDLAFRGLWYGLDAGQQLHLMLLDNPYRDCDKPKHGGRDNHIAMHVDDFSAIVARLDAAKIPYSMSKSGRKALFCRDPDNNTIELMA